MNPPHWGNTVKSSIFHSSSPETKMELNLDLAEARKLISQDDKNAVFPLGRFLDKTKELMFEVAVDCECRKGGQ